MSWSDREKAAAILLAMCLILLAFVFTSHPIMWFTGIGVTCTAVALCMTLRVLRRDRLRSTRAEEDARRD